MGIKITSDLKWDVHIADVTKRASGRLFMLSMLKRHGLCLKDLDTVYVGFIPFGIRRARLAPRAYG